MNWTTMRIIDKLLYPIIIRSFARYRYLLAGVI